MTDSILKPSEFAGYILDGEDSTESQLTLSEILESQGIHDQEEEIAKVQSEDSSTKHSLDQLKSDIFEQKDLESPNITINVESPSIIIGESIKESEKSTSTNDLAREEKTIIEKNEPSVTNNYTTNLEKTENPKQIDNANISPSELIKTEAATKPDSSDKAEVKVISDNSPIPVELVNAMHQKKSEYPSNAMEEITGATVINELANTEKIITEFTKESNTLVEALKEKQDHPIDIRIVSEPNKLATLFEILNSEDISPIERTVPNQELNRVTDNPDNSINNIDYSTLLIESIKDSQSVPDPTKVVSDSSSQIIKELAEKDTARVEQSIENFDSTLSTIFVPSLIKLTETLPSEMNNLREVISKNTEQLEKTIETVIVLPSKLFEIEHNTKEIQKLEVDSPRVQNAKSELSPTLTKSILATPEEKKLEQVTQQLTNVQNALREVNESQINNMNAITNTSMTNTITNNAEQKTVLGESNLQTEVQKEEIKEQKEPMASLSEYYLQAIYDALVGSGIKIKGY